MDDVIMKQVFLNSFPEPLGNKAVKHLHTQGLQLQQVTLGRLYQEIQTALQRLCNQQQFFKTWEKTTEKLKDTCDTSYLKIKCKDQSCHCPTKKKSHFTCLPKHKFHPHKHKHLGSSRRQGKGKHYRYFKRKKFCGKTSDRCFSCGKKGHFAKSCPDKQKKAKLIHMLTQFDAADDKDADIESLYSIDDEFSSDLLFALEYCNSDSESGLDTISSMSDGFDPVYPLSQTPLPLCPSTQKITLPLAPLYIFPSAWDHPVKVIGYFDTGATMTILAPHVLPPCCWRSHKQYFTAADGKTFFVDLISKEPIKFKILPTLIVSHRVLGSSLPGRDALSGFDLLTKFRNLQWSSQGLTYKKQFLPWTTTPSLFSLTPLANIKQLLISKCCADSHTEFLAKCDHPLWQNSQFFIRLPFKKNEDVNATKASHSGMNPHHLALAQEEVTLLQTQGLIEPTSSPWACEAFYVNKRAEQTRGKLRLVINYQPLNAFLADDKFPLPTRPALMLQLSTATIFSKFDLKARFW
ncbi:uncharacterized protein LOC122638919 [Telopea speciosissima]|uniref:uncharacterized protein LOC122638919 n=1 Tax=Telopea speciosissima TaxID=54955 RepID=UPI001CC68CCB|nr:uncharacterized protein LOC122638919 [Telopea speciosissima]